MRYVVVKDNVTSSEIDYNKFSKLMQWPMVASKTMKEVPILSRMQPKCEQQGLEEI